MRKKTAFFQAFLRHTAAFLLLATLLPLLGCRTQYHTVRSYGMGTFCVFMLEEKERSDTLTALLASTEATLSHHKENSFPDRLAKEGTVLGVDQELIDALLLAEDVKEKTDGKFSLSVLPLTRLWQFDTEAPVPPDATEIADALALMSDSRLLIGEREVTLAGGGIDLGALGKGYACDVLARDLYARGESGMISVGGSIAVVGSKGEKPWMIGVRDPFSSSQNDILGTLALGDTYVSTSGSYEKTFTYDGISYHHILDPKTGMPAVSDLVSATVIAESGVLSDILSTACFLVGSEKAFDLAMAYNASLIAVKTDGTLLVSEGLRYSFTTGGGREILYR